jgi:hypothetical protein
MPMATRLANLNLSGTLELLDNLTNLHLLPTVPVQSTLYGEAVHIGLGALGYLMEVAADESAEDRISLSDEQSRSASFACWRPLEGLDHVRSTHLRQASGQFEVPTILGGLSPTLDSCGRKFIGKGTLRARSIDLTKVNRSLSAAVLEYRFDSCRGMRSNEVLATDQQHGKDGTNESDDSAHDQEVVERPGKRRMDGRN